MVITVRVWDGTIACREQGGFRGHTVSSYRASDALKRWSCRAAAAIPPGPPSHQTGPSFTPTRLHTSTLALLTSSLVTCHSIHRRTCPTLHVCNIHPTLAPSQVQSSRHSLHTARRLLSPPDTPSPPTPLIDRHLLSSICQTSTPPCHSGRKLPSRRLDQPLHHQERAALPPVYHHQDPMAVYQLLLRLQSTLPSRMPTPSQQCKLAIKGPAMSQVLSSGWELQI